MSYMNDFESVFTLYNISVFPLFDEQTSVVNSTFGQQMVEDLVSWLAPFFVNK